MANCLRFFGRCLVLFQTLLYKLWYLNPWLNPSAVIVIWSNPVLHEEIRSHTKMSEFKKKLLFYLLCPFSSGWCQYLAQNAHKKLVYLLDDPDLTPRGLRLNVFRFQCLACKFCIEALFVSLIYLSSRTIFVQTFSWLYKKAQSWVWMKWNLWPEKAYDV